MTARSSAVLASLPSRPRSALAPVAIATLAAMLSACAQTPAAAPAQPAAPAATAPSPAVASVAPSTAQSTSPQVVAAAGLSASEEQIVPRQYANNPKVDAFIGEVAARDGFDAAKLRALFATANYSATAVKLVMPARSPSVKNWRVYQSRFLDTIRINAGVKFWRANQATLQRASAEFGVPPEVIVGIIGVETMSRLFSDVRFVAKFKCPLLQGLEFVFRGLLLTQCRRSAVSQT